MSANRGDKTEQATPKRKREAREKGQVLKSTDVVVALSMLTLVGALSVFGPYLADNMKKLMVGFFSMEIPDTLTLETVAPALTEGIYKFLIIMIPVLASAFLAALLFNYLQVGFLFSPKAARPKFSRISPAQGLKRIFSKRTLAELVKSIIRLTVLCIVAYNEYEAQIQNVSGLMGTSVAYSAEVAVDMALGIAFKLALALVIMAPVDFLYQWWQHRKDLMMTKQEVKEEYKLMEGDPQIKGKIRQKQRAMSASRMMKATAEADVIITNPTHYAIALAYKEEMHTAPVILAKGKDFMAKRIKETAKEHGIELVENKKLAQHLYFFCEIGDEVPEEMYQAVAEILAYIYNMKNERGRGEIIES